jgi:hypothetical protein
LAEIKEGEMSKVKQIQVDLLGDGTRENPYHPDLPRQYWRYIDETRTFVDVKSKKITVVFSKEITLPVDEIWLSHRN